MSFNYMLSTSENRDRTTLFAYASAVTGVVVFSMTLFGGFLATRLPVMAFESPLQGLFLLSAILRFLALAFFFPRLRVSGFAPQESGERHSAQDLYNEFPGYRVGLGLLRNFFRAFRG